MAFLAACGGDNSGSSGAAATAGNTAASGSGGTTGAGATTGATVAGVDPGAKSFNLYTWAEYDDPDLMKSFGTITIDVYNSNEEAVAKLEAAKGTSGYDMVVPSGPYVPQMVAKDLLEPLDLSLVPNFGNLAPQYTNQSFDPGNKYSVCKDFGSTGWIYDNTVIKTPITSWSDFIKVAQNEASGQMSVLEAAPDVCGIYFWANGIDWNTENTAELDACEDVIVNQLAPHIRPSTRIPASSWRRGTTSCRRCSTVTPAKACSRSTIPSATPGGSGRRRASCGWTTGASSKVPRTGTPPTTSSTHPRTRELRDRPRLPRLRHGHHRRA